MSQIKLQSLEEKRARYREYARRRYEMNPDRHEQDKERCRQYMLKRRQDPYFRQMEMEKRKERRRLKREMGQSPKSTAPAQHPVRKYTPRATKMKREVDLTVEYLDEDASPDHVIETTEVVEEDVISEYEDEHDTVEVYSDSQRDAEESIASITLETEQEEEQAIAISSIESMTSLCECMSSAAVRKFAALSQDMTATEKRRLELSLINNMEDFLNTPPEDSFLTLICDKLKRVPDDLRPDLEVSILRIINETFKSK